MFLGKNYIIQLFVCQSSCSNVFLSNKGRYFRHKSKLNNRGKADFYCFFIFSYFLMVFIGMISFIKLFTLSILFIISLRQQYMKKYLNKQLTKQQDQAYEGAKCFYNYVLPMFIAIAFIVQSFYILKKIYIGNNVLIYQLDLWIDTYLYALFAAITYYLASIFYNKCHEIDTTALTTLLIRDSQLLIQQSQEQQDTLLDKQKPNKHYCKICLIVCDYRTKHCRKCQVCIQTYDHHCFWLGNCVGRYNYKEFYFFLLLQSANNYFTLVIMHRLNEHFQINIYVYIFRLVGMLMALGFLCFTGYLSLYHTILISCGMTTWQHMRRSSISYLKYLPIGYNPFSLGFYQNWKKFITQNESRQLSKHKQWQQYLPSFQQSKYIEPSFNLIQNEYYSCC